MKVHLSDKQCAKKHKKFFISLHFPLLLYFSLFWKQEKRERSHKGFIRKFEICTSTLNMSSEKMFSNCLCCCCSLCLKIIILSFSYTCFLYRRLTFTGSNQTVKFTDGKLLPFTGSKFNFKKATKMLKITQKEGTF